MGQGHKLLDPTIAPQNLAVRPLGRRGGFYNCYAFIAVCLDLLFINVGVSSSIQETYRTTRHSFEFIHDAFQPLHYPKCAFNDFPLRDHLNSTVIDGVGKWNGYILVYRFSWKFGQIICLPFCPSYKKESKRLPLLHRDLSILLKSENP